MSISSITIAKVLSLLLLFHGLTGIADAQSPFDVETPQDIQELDDRNNSERSDGTCEELRESIEVLLSDLQSLVADSEISQQQIENLKDSLINLLADAQRPSQESVETLITDLMNALEDGQLDIAEKLLLLEDWLAVLESANIAPEDVENVISDVLVIIEASNMDLADVMLILNDLKAVYDALGCGRVRF